MLKSTKTPSALASQGRAQAHTGPQPPHFWDVIFIVLAWVIICAPARGIAAIRVLDDSGQTIVLQAPASRIVSLAPHTTEMLYYAGAGDRIVATVRFADYPDAAKKIPRVGDSALLDIERIVRLKPDLIVVWLHGNAERQLDKLRSLGIPIFYSEPHRIADIADELIRLGQLAGTEPAARKAASEFNAHLDQLTKQYSNRPLVSVFYQVWKTPLLTINGRQIISDAISLCGGRNVFVDSSLLVPTVDIEAVANADPEAIVASGTGPEAGNDFDIWRRLPSLRATAGNNLILIHSEALSRHSPRILEGAALLCNELDGVRARRKP